MYFFLAKSVFFMKNCISKTAAIMFNKDKDMSSKISHPIKWALLLSLYYLVEKIAFPSMHSHMTLLMNSRTQKHEKRQTTTNLRFLSHAYT